MKRREEKRGRAHQHSDRPAHIIAQTHTHTHTQPHKDVRKKARISSTYRLLVGHERLHEEVELVPLEDLLQVHLGQHHAVRGVLGRVVQIAQPLILHIA